MNAINYLMVDQKKNSGVTAAGRRARPMVERFWWHGRPVCLYLIPAAWTQSKRLPLLIRKMGLSREEDSNSGEGMFWTAPELEDCLPGVGQPLPDPSLAAFLLREQPFREILVLLTDEKEEGRKDWWQEDFLRECFGELNGLYLTGVREKERDASFFDWMYGESGLLACFSDRLPVTDGRKTAVVDLRRKKRPPVRELAFGSLYLDLTSETEKQRLLREKRTDISYISARNYLDTAFKARYNAF